MSESAAHAAGISGVRNYCPPNAITLWIEYAHNNISKFIKGIVSIDVDDVPYTSIDMKFYNETVLTNKYDIVSSETKDDGKFTVSVSRTDVTDNRIYVYDLK